jgi:LysR family transcriptional regulator, glycine cleavage system transcriptional activator
MLPPLDSLRCFVEAARALNFRAAARSVALTPAALGQHVRRLEDQLGVTLFHRTTRRVVLTEAGRSLLPAAERALDAAEACVRAARGELGPAPMELVVGTRHELGLSWLTPMLPRLREAHPGVSFHLYFGSGPDLELRVRYGEVDCAVSSRRITDPKLDNLRLHREDYVFVGARRLLDAKPLKSPADAAQHVLVDTTDELPLFRYFRDAPGGADSLEFASLVRMGTVAAIRALVLASDGVAVLPRYLVARDLAAGRLRTVMPKVTPLSDWFRLIFRTDDPRRAFYQALATTLLRVPLR